LVQFLPLVDVCVTILARKNSNSARSDLAAPAPEEATLGYRILYAQTNA
jgi:hypothetical protein